MAPIDLVAIVTPKSGKADRFLELFQNCVDYAEKHEPYVTRYELHRGEANGKEQFIINESYQDQAGMDKHMKAELTVTMISAIEKEGLFEASQIIMTRPGPSISARL